MLKLVYAPDPILKKECQPRAQVDDHHRKLIKEKMSSYSLSHLKQLEAESIHIIREVAAEFDNPVMLYSIGKDSSVMLHLAHKAFSFVTFSA